MKILKKSAPVAKTTSTPIGRMALLQTRCVNRPAFKQFEKSMQIYDQYEGTGVDFYLSVNGSGELESYVPEKLRTGSRLIDLRDKPEYYGIAGVLEATFKNPDLEPYEFIGFLDDDALYPDPVAASKQMLDLFDANPQLAALGPIDGFRMYMKYHNTPEPLNLFKGRPYCAGGSQIYRMSALRQVDLSLLENLKFRSDFPLWMLLKAIGYEGAEIPIPFEHRVSSGQGSKTWTQSFYDERMQQVENDYIYITKALEKTLPSGDDDTDLVIQKMLKDLPGLQKNERNACSRRILKTKDMQGAMETLGIKVKKTKEPEPIVSTKPAVKIRIGGKK